MNTEPLIQNISIESIIPNRFQPRLTFDEKALNELANSIKEHGIIQPLVLRRLGDKYEIIAGERRYKAATIAGLTEVPAIISNIDDNKSAEIALVENVQRKNLNSLEEAKSYKKILDKENLTQEDLAKKMGISQSTIANKLRLLNLANEVQEALMNEKISERHARSLLQLNSNEEQIMMLNKIINERLTVRQLDDEIKKMTNPSANVPNSLNPEVSPEQTETLDIDIEEIKKNAEDIISKKEKGILNIFDNNIPEYPSLEDEVTNMNTEQIDTLEGFNPFNQVDSITENIETNSSENIFDSNDLAEPVVEAPIIKEKKVELEKQANLIEPNNLETVKSAYQNLAKEIEKAGFHISIEDFDFEDLYQIIIKIDKQA